MAEGVEHARDVHDGDGSSPEHGGPPLPDDGRGRHAERPTEVPARGWLDVAKRVVKESKADQVALLAAGVAFFGLLALVPALIALLSIYGLVADPDDITRQVDDALAAAPDQVREVIGQQLTDIQDSSGGAITAVVIGIAIALFSASSGVNHLIDALNIAYDEEETRGMVKRRGLALLLTLGAIGFAVVAVAGIAVLPALLGGSDLGTPGRIAVQVVRWTLLLVGMLVGLAVLYRYAPDRDAPRWSWASAGAVFATLAWIVASVLFSLYVSNFGSYNETYGSLGAIVVVMLWLYLTAVVIIVGAELNTELERQTAADTTQGPREPMGHREAYAADTVAT